MPPNKALVAGPCPLDDPYDPDGQNILVELHNKNINFNIKMALAYKEDAYKEIKPQQEETKAITICVTTTEAALYPASTINKLHVRVHVSLTPVTTYRTQLAQVYYG